MEPCHICESPNAPIREYDWLYRPRIKEICKYVQSDPEVKGENLWKTVGDITASGQFEENTFLDVNMCDECHSHVPIDFQTIGWDWSEAMDGVYGTIEESKRRQEFRKNAGIP